MNNINIGITLSLKSETQSVWENGIIQNTIYFYKLLQNSTKNYNLILLNTNEKIKDFSQLPWDTNDIKISNISDEINNIDLLIMMGAQITENTANIVKKNNGKVITYYCGNHYIMEMEKILFDDDAKSINFGDFYDDIWMIPQIYNTNNYYLGALHGNKKTKSVPFVWDSYFIDKLRPHLDNNGNYSINEKKTISTFEPNLNVVKFSMYPMLIYEYYYNNFDNTSKIDSMYVTNSLKLKENKLFVSLMNHLNIKKKHKVSFEGRFNTPWFLSKHTDIVIEHQWENPLNYLYLDAAYLGYPIIHNAHMVKDLGYYYEEFDVKKGAELLDYVVKHHDNQLDDYNQKTNKVLDRFRPTNLESIEIYDNLINDLFKK